MPPSADTFHARLSSSMSARGVDRHQLAKHLGCGPSAVTSLVNGKRVPSLPTLAKIGDALGWDDTMRGMMLNLAAEMPVGGRS
jgi:transcriptional regulator with XRE-family HTH domain